jgi:hypothetical protein
MAVIITKSPNEYSFVGNSVVFEFQADSPAIVRMEITAGSNTYSATYYPYKISGNQFRIHADISDYLEYESDTEIQTGGIIIPVSGFSLPYQVDILDEEDNLIYQFSGAAFRGGISNRAIRKLEENGYDIWTYRLASYFDQFVFTARTNGKEIKLKETELFPFIFVHPGIPIIFKSESGTEITTPAQTAGTVCAMDIQSVLEQMPSGTKRVDVCPDGEYAFHFSILPGKLSEEKYLLRFRNSLGAFEVMEITGRAMHAPEFSEESLYETLTGFDFYEEHRSRVKSKGVIEVETGYRERREFPFVMDMIQSDEIYFSYPDGNSFRCHVKADSAQYRQFMTEPTSVGLKIREVLEENYSTPELEFDETGLSIRVNPSQVNFPENGGSQTIHVTGSGNHAFEIVDLPPWLHVANQTSGSFELVAGVNATENTKSVWITVRLVNNPSVYDRISVSQEGSWLTEIVYELTTLVANETPAVCIKLSAAEGNGEAKIQWEENGAWDSVDIPQGNMITVTPENPVFPPFQLAVPVNIPHTFATPGVHTVRVKTRKGVNAVAFADVNEQGGDWAGQPVPNQVITRILKFKSGTLTSIARTFAGLTHCVVGSDFVIETPNVNHVFMAFSGFASNVAGNFRFPAGMLSQLTSDGIIDGTRMFMGCGIEAIEEGFLDHFTHLTSVMEMFRGCGNLGHDWYGKYGGTNHDGTGEYMEPVSEFIPESLFWNCHSINNFEGCFNWIGQQWHGAMPSGYAWKWRIKRNIFKNNTALNINLSWMFNKAARVIIEPDVFGLIKDRMVNLNCVFYGVNYPDPRRGGGLIWDGVTCELGEIFPDALYPSVTSMVGAFSVDDLAESDETGFNSFWTKVWGGEWGVAWNGDPAFTANKLDAAGFVSKFPNATAASATGNTSYAGADGMASMLPRFALKAENYAAAGGGRNEIITTYIDLN